MHLRYYIPRDHLSRSVNYRTLCEEIQRLLTPDDWAAYCIEAKGEGQMLQEVWIEIHLVSLESLPAIVDLAKKTPFTLVAGCPLSIYQGLQLSPEVIKSIQESAFHLQRIK